jgi:hypothetical protein
MANDDDTTPETPDAPSATDPQSEPEAREPEVAAQVEDFADSFKTAAQKVLEERFGMQQKEDGTVDFTKIDGDKVKHNAQALITGLMSQLAGLTPPTDSSPKSDAAAPVPATTDDNVIDLESARRARAPREASPLEQRISESIKSTFNAYVQDNLVPDGSSGQVKLNVDGEMLREHGPQVLTALFGAFTKSIFPEGGVEVDLPGEPPEAPAAEAEGEASEDEAAKATDEQTGETGKVDVKLNVDVAGLFRSLIDGVAPKK